MKLFADGADFDGIVKASENLKIVGFTTNPTLMRQAGVTDYSEFAHKVLDFLSTTRPDTCISFEVFADDRDGMIQQALKIHEWSSKYNYPIYVKIPIMFTNGESTNEVIKHLSAEGVKLNVTAVFTVHQVIATLANLNPSIPSIISIFAGRIADAGVDPIEVFGAIKAYRFLQRDSNMFDKVELLWASPRESYNYIQAEHIGADIITMTPDLIKKLDTFGKDLTEFSLDTCKMFFNDATKSGFTI